MLCIPVHEKRLSNRAERMKTIPNSQDQTTKIVAKVIIAAELGQIVRCSSNYQQEVNYEVHIFREKPVGKWMDPYPIREMEDKSLNLGPNNRCLAAFVDMVKQYNELDLL